MESYIGRTLGDFEIVQVLGKGGQGFVFLARQMPLKRDVALKVIPVLASVSSSHVKRFIREAEATAKLKHPNIIEVYQIGQEAEHYFYAMELVDGWSLDKIIGGMKDYTLREQEAVSEAEAAAEPETLLEDDQFHLKEPDVILQVAASGGTKEGDYGQDDVSQASTEREDVAQADNLQLDPRHYERLPSEYYRWAANIIEQAAKALEHAHQNGIIHRDIKPSNIMVSREEVVKITDFGLARDVGEKTMTITGKPMGTPAYMSPEQIRARLTPIDKRTDIYSLGVTLYEAISLDRPFRGQTTQELYHNISVKEPRDPRRTNPNAPRDLAVIALKAVEKDPDRRYQSAKEMAEDLDRYLRNAPILAKPPTLVNKTVKFVKRDKVQVSIVSLVAAIFIALLGTVYMKIQRDQVEERLEEAKGKTEQLARKIKELLEKARKAEAEKRYGDARSFYKEILQLDPDNRIALYQLEAEPLQLYDEAEALKQQRQYDKAIMRLEEIRVRHAASSFAPKAEDLIKEIEADRKAKTLFDEGVAAKNAEQYDVAKSKLVEVARLYPASPFRTQADDLLDQIRTDAGQLDDDAKYMWDAAMKHKGKENYDKAAELLKKLKELFPGSNLAGQTDQEIAALEQAKLDKYEKAAGESLDKARQSRADKNYDEAITQYRAMLDEFPEGKLKDHAQQEIEETKTEKYEGEAQEAFDEATALFETKKFGEAAELFDKVVKDYPDSKLKEQAQARVTEAREARDAAFQVTFQAAKAAFDQKDFSGALRKVLEGRGLDLAQDKKDALSLLYNRILSEIIIGTDGRSINASHLLPRVRSVRDVMEMVLVHEGPFTMGADDGDGDESPMRQVELDAFYIDVHEVTNEQYEQFLNWIALNEHDRRYCHQSEPQGWSHAPQGPDRKHSWTVEAGEFYDYPPGKDRYPVTYVSWYDAYSYAAWAGKSLPTEAQWEKAARGDKRANKYPWGQLMVPGRCACEMASGTAITPREAGRLRKGASPYGCLDMAGNVKEWCMDWYGANYYEQGENQNPPGPAFGEQRVLRGGSWKSFEHDVRTMSRESGLPGDRSLGLGFRCVINILK